MESPFDEKTNPGTNFRYFEGRLLFQKRFLLKRMAGRGGMGEVWLATDTQLGKDVALKFTPQEMARDERSLAELRREVTVGQELTHPRIVRVHDFLHGEGEAAISMEYVDGRSSSDVQSASESLFFEPEEIRPWVDDVLQALDYAHHEGKRAHRDVKPKNILIENATNRAKLADFGISRRIVDTMARHSRPDTSGALPYMSLQQQAGLLKPAPQDDFYSLGATIYEWVTGAAPFYQGDIADQVKHQIPPPMATRRADLVGEIISNPGQPIPEGWERAVAACLSKERDQRPSRAAEFWALVNAQESKKTEAESTPRSVARDDESSANRATAAPPTAASPRRTKIIAAVAGIILLFAGLTWAVTQMKSQPIPKPAMPDSAIAQMKEEQEKIKQEQDRIKREHDSELADQKQKTETLRVHQEKLRKEKAEADEKISKAKQEVEKQQLALEQLRKEKDAADAKTKVANDAVVKARLDEELAKAEQQRQAELAKAAKFKSPSIATKNNPFVNSIGMRLIPGAKYANGRLVLMSAWETRVADFKRFIKEETNFSYIDGEAPMIYNGREFKPIKDAGWNSPGFDQSDLHPVTCVSKSDADAFCLWLTNKEQVEKIITKKMKYRLPTKAEWQLAAELKNEAIFPWGDNFPPPKNTGNYHKILNVDSFDRTSPVGSFAPNINGFYDMLGNVKEWSDDDLQGLFTLLGGSWHCHAEMDLMSNSYFHLGSKNRDSTIGFRCVLEIYE